MLNELARDPSPETLAELKASKVWGKMDVDYDRIAELLRAGTREVPYRPEDSLSGVAPGAAPAVSAPAERMIAGGARGSMLEDIKRSLPEVTVGKPNLGNIFTPRTGRKLDVTLPAGEGLERMGERPIE